jgi:cardiolipin synthase A/B
LNVVDEAFAKKQAAIFDADKARSRQVTWEKWQDRGVVDKVGDTVAALLDMQL